MGFMRGRSNNDTPPVLTDMQKRYEAMKNGQRLLLAWTQGKTDLTR